MINLTAVGNLGRNPEQKDAGGSTVTEFSIAAKTGKDDSTWIKCSIWGKRGQAAMDYMKKGDQVAVSGSAKLVTFAKRDGTQGSKLELNVSDFTLPARPKAASTPSDDAAW